MQIDKRVYEQLEVDGHYLMSVELKRFVEGLKGEVTRLKELVEHADKVCQKMSIKHIEKETDLLKTTNIIVEQLRQEVERYRTALEEIKSKPIIKISGPDLIDLKYEINDIARKAIEGSHETP